MNNWTPPPPFPSQDSNTLVCGPSDPFVLRHDLELERPLREAAEQRDFSGRREQLRRMGTVAIQGRRGQVKCEAGAILGFYYDLIILALSSFFIYISPFLLMFLKNLKRKVYPQANNISKCEFVSLSPLTYYTYTHWATYNSRRALQLPLALVPQIPSGLKEERKKKSAPQPLLLLDDGEAESAERKRELVRNRDGTTGVQ